MEQRDARHDYLRFSHLGLQFAVSLGLCFLVGFWADGKLGTTPLLALLGLAAGFGLGFYQLVTGTTRRGPRAGDEDERRGQGPRE